MSKNYKNIINLREKTFGVERRKNLTKEVLQDSTPLPNPLEYSDIDNEFIKWVDKDLEIISDGEVAPTFTLLSNQRFSEYMQSWQNVDENKNLILNFKSVTRENNPKFGTIVGDSKNIPGDIDFLMKRVSAVDKSGHRYFIEYRVKQPLPIDFNYTIGFFTNKYEKLNEFNLLINDKFKSIDCYIRPNGHFIPMTLEDISDESEYSIDNRRFYSQSYTIKVKGYIMPKESFSTREVPELTFSMFDEENRKSYAEIEELPCSNGVEINKNYAKILLTINIPQCKTNGKFTIDCDFMPTEIKLTNVKYFNIFINDKKIDISDGFDFVDRLNESLPKLELKKGDNVRVSNVARKNSTELSRIELIGYDYTNVLDKSELQEIKTREIIEKC